VFLFPLIFQLKNLVQLKKKEEKIRKLYSSEKKNFQKFPNFFVEKWKNFTRTKTLLVTWFW